MRLCISLIAKKDSITLPIHYNRLVQGMIYANISSELAAFLHDRGYMDGNRSFKLFTYSRLLGKYVLDQKQKKITFPQGATLYVSSPIKEFCTSLMGSMLQRPIQLGSLELETPQIKVEKLQVNAESITVNTLSPIVIYSTLNKPDGSTYTHYFQPGEQQFSNQLAKNLRKKYLSYYRQEAPQGNITVQVLNRPQQNITKYKQTIIKGYSCKLKLNGPRELLQLAIDAGVGAKNSQGFGCLTLV